MNLWDKTARLIVLIGRAAHAFPPSSTSEHQK